MYESWFQLSKRPFGAAPQTADYYPSESMELARQNIVRCIEGSGGPSILIGGPGCGKSTLCLKLQEQFWEDAPTGYFSCCGVRTRRELLQQILFAFGRPYDANDEGELRISLTHFVQSQGEARLVLLIDDVDDLPAELFEELRSISNLTHDGNWCVNLVLAGKSKLEELLGRPGMESLDQRIASRNYLGKWNSAETVDYVRYQIARVGGDATEIFTEEALEQIKETTDGLPRLVNQVCDHAMIMAGLGNVRQLDAMHIKEAWADLQQLPPPKRHDAATESDQNESMIEFGTLDGDSELDNWTADSDSKHEEETQDNSDCVQSDDLWNAVTAAENELEGRCVNDGESAIVEFGTMDDENEFEVNSIPETEEAFESCDHITEMVSAERAFDESSVEFDEPSDGSIRLADSSQGDLVDRLDDIEREVQRVSTELQGGQPAAEPDFSQAGGDGESTASSNPFLEIFDEEEIVFGNHNTLNNELVHRQPAVFTSGGDALIDVIRMVDQGSKSNQWELLDDVTGSQPADDSLKFELAASPFLMARHEPEIMEVNESGVNFAESEFTFNYSAPIELETTEYQSLNDSSPADAAEFDSLSATQQSIDDGTDENAIIVGGSVEEQVPIDGVCGSSVGDNQEFDLEIIATGDVTIEEQLGGDLELSEEPRVSDQFETCESEVVDGQPTDCSDTGSIDCDDELDTKLDEEFESPEWDTHSNADDREGNGETASRWHADQPGMDSTQFHSRETPSEPEPIAQATMPRGQSATSFSNRTQFGSPLNGGEDKADSPTELRWSEHRQDVGSSPEPTESAANPNTELKKKRKFTKLFSYLKSNRTTGN